VTTKFTLSPCPTIMTAKQDAASKRPDPRLCPRLQPQGVGADCGVGALNSEAFSDDCREQAVTLKSPRAGINERNGDVTTVGKHGRARSGCQCSDSDSFPATTKSNLRNCITFTNKKRGSHSCQVMQLTAIKWQIPSVQYGFEPINTGS